MDQRVREMGADEVDIVVGYFHAATSEYLETLGVDPTRLPPADEWRDRLARQCLLPPAERSTELVVWEADGEPVGFSTSDSIVHGDRARMHLHIVDPGRRRSGLGAVFVRLTVGHYFDRLRLRRLFCEPNAFNLAPNRTLQQAGFRYVKTYMTVPGPLNFHQAVTRWVVER